MRSPLLLTTLLGAPLCATPVLAQQATLPAAVAPDAATAFDPALPITTPPGATVQVEVDLRDDDLLGVFKSFLRGIGEGVQNAQPAASPAGTSPARPDMGSQLTAALSSADLADVLKDVTHVHFVLMQLPGASPTPTVVTPAAFKTTLTGVTVKPAPVPKAVPAPVAPAPPPPPPAPDVTPQYETTFAKEGGHRVIYTNIDPVHLVMTSFGHAHGYAMVVQVPGILAVMRADGYPDLSKISALATQIATVAAKAYSTTKSTGPTGTPPPK